MASLEAKHKEEVKQLRVQVQELRRTVSKGDKKRKKEVNEEILLLERALEEKHATERKDAECETLDPSVEKSSTPNGMQRQDRSTTGKMSKAQRRREKREREDRERSERIAKAELETGPDLREVEEDKLISQVKALNLSIRNIEPDGNCLYAAISDQLAIHCKLKASVKELREKCASYMREREEQFLPFAMDHITGEPCSHETFERYCDNVANSYVWGGQPEIEALCNVYKVSVCVHQADHPLLVIGEEYDGSERLHLSYHHHAFGLGEHYNSVVPHSC